MILGSVDLNLIRAALAETLEQSEFTSVQRRITSRKLNGPDPEESQAWEDSYAE
jgi:hypothetical protein